MTHTLTPELASKFAGVALGHVRREYPNKLDHVLDGPEDAQGPRALHPIFYGSFDWHSCVHSHWLLAKIYRLFPQIAETVAIRALLDGQFTPEKVAGEIAYLARPSARGFERPYGWAWLLMLQGELLRHEGKHWASTLQPLADAFVQRFEAFLPLCTYPIRSGVHSSTSFALTLAMSYAKQVENEPFARLIRGTASRWHDGDADANPFEPSQSDFLSPTLMEAALMRSVMEPDPFRAWLAKFLPVIPQALLTPAIVTDRSDGQIAHLDGLNLSRAWCWRLIAGVLPPSHPWQKNIAPAIDALLSSALDHIAGDYMGEHWLASFALLALEPFA
jgi:hypothetical protein